MDKEALETLLERGLSLDRIAERFGVCTQAPCLTGSRSTGSRPRTPPAIVLAAVFRGIV
jgi:hypothetical protein